MVDPNLGLQAASGLVSFLLKTTLEWLVCVVVVRLAGSARWRFNLWLGMLLAFAAQWGWMWSQVARVSFASGGAAPIAAQATRAEAVRRIAVAQPTAVTLGDVMAALALAYATVAIWKSFRMLAGHVRLARAMRHARPPSRRLAEAFGYVLGEAQAAGVELEDCELRVLPGITSPATVGWRRPIVLVPPVCELQDMKELAAIFWHELKHVQRKDALWNAMGQLCSGLVWFHPAVRHAAAELKAQRELACDAAVIREHPQARDVYASCLLRFARLESAGGSATGAIEMASAPALLTQRVRTILTERPRASGWSRACRASANLALVVITIAGVPRLNVLFAENAAGLNLPTPTVGSRTAELPMASRRSATSAVPSARLHTLTASSTDGPRYSNAVLPSVPHDEALAAEHRAAAGILTESTGIDTVAAGTARDYAAGAEAPSPHRHGNPASLGRIAVDATERIGPLMNDHDGDRHWR